MDVTFEADIGGGTSARVVRHGENPTITNEKAPVDDALAMASGEASDAILW